ncbi:MAG: TIGR03560 family F420-dependent LLM class oxidoreductase [Actinobacteria bacterium]|jgi:F420-dependent oxidoreductase-like protein|nr:TIGR03560 family F420-dependent LLM class oxidoreductase [Actinomycetota bacterium]
MRYGIDVSQHQLTWEGLLERTRWAEEAGFDGAWVFDHFKALYGDPSGPCLEGWTLLAALAARTDRIRLGTLVTGVTYRHPSILTTEAITVDHVSGGRLELAMGAAWHSGEHEEFGIEFPTAAGRIHRLEEAVQVMRLLMTEDGANFNGRYFSLKDASYNPKPVQSPMPPLWIGGSGEKLMLPLIARHADVWHAGGSIATLKRKSDLLNRHAEEAGRDPGDIRRASYLAASDPIDECKKHRDELETAGFDYVVVSWPAEGLERMEPFVAEVMN